MKRHVTEEDTDDKGVYEKIKITVRYHDISTRMPWTKCGKTISDIGEDVEKLVTHAPLVGV